MVLQPSLSTVFDHGGGNFEIACMGTACISMILRGGLEDSGQGKWGSIGVVRLSATMAVPSGVGQHAECMFEHQPIIHHYTMTAWLTCVNALF